ncbi:ATP-grasp domain-containing protein [Limosilactobacillus reuteri]|jgi:5-(carboxyamino)imidazole ribonucleotide synthase|uniref:ATP-grasp domain-containing protein n=1 Tax=Limosilactobacillus reuteri TaxID=1598 RepID=UPI001C3FD133|nr:ATP-grasp domain-containing protein [Limosilactobacillus reuteri]MBW3349267.1 ATP-grasp domain-containing protein [Limosilactobacillus reuteri]MCC4328437.1 ATP-grasp domain-containing protein [Limosilactobacillus reuteri]MCC4336708.1 ATP-grasp domain-containing protein [Limosilactobacillus reuteri]MCC4338477.1 ATP-grasp domain-containing protein [Limosilactobacillus reuteri]MCC4396975.1 ATP-grasp domain-containing protein [Limosilactobacillus reuteri]
MGRDAIYPGSTLGIIGINRNGAALIAAAKKAGFNVGVYVDRSQPSVTKMADFTIVGAMNDRAKLTQFGEACDAVIYQTPNVDSRVLHFLSQYAVIPQGINALEIVQDRLMERAFLDQVNINIAPYVTVVSLDDVYQSIDSIGYPALLKPIQRGIGENSMLIERQSDITRAADFIDTGTYLLESWIEHTNEYTMTAATDGKDTEIFPLAQLHYNDKRQLISVATPANIHDDMLKEMQRIVKSVAASLEYRGVFSVNFYVTSTGTLYVKNIEPGLTSIANIYDVTANVDQYEEQLRSAVGMPLHVITPLQIGLLMVVRNYQSRAIQRQWLLKNNWQFRFFNDVGDDDQAILGFVWVTGGDNLAALKNQVDDTEVWNDQA